MIDQLDYGKLSEKIFKINLNVLFSDGSGLDISPYLKRTRIVNDYINYVMPQLRFILTLPLDIIMLIQKDRDQVVFAMEILYSAVNLVEEDMNDLDVRFYEPYMKRTMIKPLKMDDSLYDSTFLQDDSRNDEENIATANQAKFEFIGVSEDALRSNKYVTSGAFRSCNVTEAILALTTKTNNKIYMVEPDNQQIYEQIVLYPGNIYTNLFHIDNIYGIYNDDLKVYTVSDRLIIAPLNSNKILDNRAPISINVEFDKQKLEGRYYRGSYEELDPYNLKTKKQIVTNYYNVSLQNNSSLIAEVFGNNHVISARDTEGLSENEYHVRHYDRHGEFHKTRLYDDVFNNQYGRNNFLQKIQNENIISIFYENIDLLLDDGLRKFLINFNNADYKRYNGEYKCLTSSHEFITQAKGLTTISGSITLRKI